MNSFDLGTFCYVFRKVYLLLSPKLPSVCVTLGNEPQKKQIEGLDAFKFFYKNTI